MNPDSVKGKEKEVRVPTQEKKVIIQELIEVFFKTIETYYEVEMDTPPHDVANWIVEGMSRNVSENIEGCHVDAWCSKCKQMTCQLRYYDIPDGRVVYICGACETKSTQKM